MNDEDEPEPLRCARCERVTVLWDDVPPQYCDDCVFELLGYARPAEPPTEPDDAA